MKHSTGVPCVLLFSGVLAAVLAGCNGRGDEATEAAASSDVRSTELPYTVLKTLDDGTEVRNGGFGSAMTAHPSLADHFYTLTDRGPNTDYTGSRGAGKKFPVPDYTPHIALFRLTAQGEAERVRTIDLKNRNGQPITGLPNADFGATGEVAYTEDGMVLPYDPDGLDTEGLVAMADGTFWVSDEYGPHLVHYDADAVEIGRINPYPEDARNTWTLPVELAKRRPNRGMEGLAVTPDGKMLVGIMQSTLENPRAARDSDLTRIVTIDLATGATAQYLYRQEAPGLSNSEIAALTDTTFLVIERDAGYLGDNTARYKRVYKIDLTGATNVDGSNGTLVDGDPVITVGADSGLLIEGETLEQVVFGADSLDAGWGKLAAKGIRPVSKTLVLDALARLEYPHDKLEGLWVIGPTRLGLINDDDFAVVTDDDTIVQKSLPSGAADLTVLYLVDLETRLY